MSEAKAIRVNVVLYAVLLFFPSIFLLCIVSWSFDNRCIFPLLFKSETTGKIVEYVHKVHGRIPVVMFSTPNGQQYTFQSPINRCRFACKTGTPVTVVYDELSPEKAEIKNFWTLGFSALLLFFLLCSLYAIPNAVYLLVMGLLRQRGAPHLMQYGQRKIATITKIRVVGWWGGANLFLPTITKITAQWQNSGGTVYVFWDLVRRNVYEEGDPIFVMIDPNNPSYYRILLE
jgi:hypothetical protein